MEVSVRHPSPACTFLPRLPGGARGAQWQQPRVQRGFSADPGPDWGPISSGPDIQPQEGLREWVTGLTGLFDSRLAAHRDSPPPPRDEDTKLGSQEKAVVARVQLPGALQPEGLDQGGK